MELSRLDYAILKLLYSKDCRSFFKSMTLREITDQTKTARASTARLMYRLIDWGYVTVSGQHHKNRSKFTGLN